MPKREAHRRLFFYKLKQLYLQFHEVCSCVFVHKATARTGIIPCFGPEEPGKYSISYGVMDDHIEFIVYFFDYSEADREKSSGEMLRAVEEAVLDMKAVLEQTQTAKAKLGL